MFLSSKIRAVLAVMPCISAVAIGIGSPAVAQEADHTLYLSSYESTEIHGRFIAGEDVYASCGFRECSGMDLLLYDTSGNLVASDEREHHNPYLVVPYPGEFYVETHMYDCNREACKVNLSSSYGF